MLGPASTRLLAARWALAAALFYLAFPLRVHAIVLVFTDSSSGDWANLSATWNLLGSVPGQFDTANIGTYTITVSDTEMIGTLNLSGGSLTGSGNLSIMGTGSASSL